MTFIYFIYGLSFFCLGLITFLESGRPGRLPLSRQLPWLSWFGITHSLVEWTDMFLLIGVQPPVNLFLTILRSTLMPVSAVLLARFGIGIIHETGSLRSKIGVGLLSLSIPAGLFISYAVIQVDQIPDLRLGIEVATRYLIYFPANLLTGFGLLRHRTGGKFAGNSKANRLLTWAACAFFINSLMAGLAVPAVPYGLASWFNDKAVLQITGLPVQLWRALSALSVTYFIVRVLTIFEDERKKELAELEQAKSNAQQALLSAEINARDDANHWNNALLGISRGIAEMEDPDELLLKIVDTARQILKADLGYLGLWDKDGRHLELKCYTSQTERRLCNLETIVEPALLETVTSCRSVCYPQDFGSHPAPLDCGVTNHAVKNAVIVTLKLENQPFGAIWVCRETDDSFSTKDMISLEHISDQAVIAISHSFMAARLQSLAVMDERSRIAREMHDGLAQILGYLRLETQTLEALVLQGDTELVIAKLKQARRNIDLAHADVRENILSLRTTLSNEAGVLPALQEYLTEFGFQTGIKVIFENEIQEGLNVSPMTETQMVCIIQEALTNVRKHSQAKNVLLRMNSINDCLRVSVTDDGVGFRHTPGNRSFGLQTMRERAEGVGGGLTVTTHPGQGTQINLWLPLLRRQAISNIQ